MDLSESDIEFIHSNKHKEHQKVVGINTDNHNVETKRYSKLSISLTKKEKEKIEEVRDKNFGRMSISAVILTILWESKYFAEDRDE